jgi:hypothetical protein
LSPRLHGRIRIGEDIKHPAAGQKDCRCHECDTDQFHDGAFDVGTLSAWEMSEHSN